MAALAGLIGGFAGVVALVIQIWQFILSGYRIKCEIYEALDPNNGELLIGITVRNKGRLEIKVDQIYIVLEDETRAALSAFYPGSVIGRDLPIVLRMHSSESWYVKRSNIALQILKNQNTNRIHASVSLATGKVKYSNTFYFKLNKD